MGLFGFAWEMENWSVLQAWNLLVRTENIRKCWIQVIIWYNGNAEKTQSRSELFHNIKLLDLASALRSIGQFDNDDCIFGVDV